MNAPRTVAQWSPGQVWSLWDLISINASELLCALGHLRGFSQMASTALHVRPNALGPNRQMRFPESELAKLSEQAEIVKRSAIELNLDATRIQADRLIALIAEPPIPYFRRDERMYLGEIHLQLMSQDCSTLVTLVKDQMSSRTVLALEPRLAPLFEPSEPLFGAAVDRKFGSAVAEDIAEAAKCLALDRTTACVFHLMRVMEAAVQRLGQELHVTVVDKHNKDLPWGPILANIRSAVETMPHGMTKTEWQETCTLLYHVKEAWRNETMHPKQTYTFWRHQLSGTPAQTLAPVSSTPSFRAVSLNRSAWGFSFSAFFGFVGGLGFGFWATVLIPAG
jgi:hypothetical protein